MAVQPHDSPVPNRPRCAHCGELIGVYEPLIWLPAGRPRQTSQAADRDVARAGGPLFHSACFWSSRGQPEVS